MKLYKRRLGPFPYVSAVLVLAALAAVSPINTFAQEKPATPLEATAAVWDLENLSKASLSEETIMALTQHIRIKVFGVLPNYRWLERGRIKEVLDEQKFQASGCTDQSCAVEMGQLLGARKMVTGWWRMLRNRHLHCEARLPQVGDGNIWTSWRRISGAVCRNILRQLRWLQRC